MAVKAKIGAGVWDLMLCEACDNTWASLDLDHEWTDEPEQGQIECPWCHSTQVVREERG